MPDYNAAAGSSTAPETCVTRAGTTLMYWGYTTDIDAGALTEVDQVVTNLPFLATKGLNKMDAEFINTITSATLAEGASRYECRVNDITFPGLDPATTLNNARILNTCNIFVIAVAKSGVRQAFGFETPGGVFKRSARKGRFVSHTITQGDPNDATSEPSETVAYLAEHDYAPLYVDPTIDLEALVV